MRTRLSPLDHRRPTHPLRCRSAERGPALATSVAAALVMLLAVTASGVGPVAALAEVAAGTSDAGIVPIVLEGGPGGNVTCDQVPTDVTLVSSERLDWSGGQLRGTVPDGIEVLVTDDRYVSWSATFPITAVIVKGGAAANVYLADPPRLADSGLVSPVGPSDLPADVSNVTFCWDPDPSDPPVVDLLAVCRDAALTLAVGPIVSMVGPIEIRDGDVVQSSVPDDHAITFDVGTEQLEFVAPFPVVVVVTATSAHTIHHVTPPTLEGSVPLSAGSGHGDVVLCGLDRISVVVAADPVADPTSEPVPTVVVDPVLIAAGDGPPARMPLTLLAFVLLSLTGSATMLLWSREG